MPTYSNLSQSHLHLDFNKSKPKDRQGGSVTPLAAAIVPLLYGHVKETSGSNNDTKYEKGGVDF